MAFNLDIPGWMPQSELEIIEELAKDVPLGGKIVEIGSFCGRSSWCWSKSVDPSVKIYCIDIWDPDEHPYYPPSKIVKGSNSNEFTDDFGIVDSVEDAFGTLENFRYYVKDCHNITAIKGRSPEDFSSWPLEDLDLVFLDGIHHNPYFAKDVHHWYQRLKPGGLLCGDDCDRSHPDVLWTVDDFAKSMGIRYMVERRIWMLSKPV